LSKSAKSVSESENRIGGSCIAPYVAVLSITGEYFELLSTAGEDDEDDEDRAGGRRVGVVAEVVDARLLVPAVDARLPLPAEPEFVR
jgi:hypothetical protein